MNLSNSQRKNSKTVPANKEVTFKLTNKNSWLLWCCQLLNLSSLWLELSTWMIAFIALCLSWQAVLIRNKCNSNVGYGKSNFSTNKPITISPLLLTIIALSGCIAISISARSFGVLVSMIHLLTFAYTLKAFEIKKRKDFYQLLLLGLFLLASALIFKQTLDFSLVIILILIVNLTVLHSVFSPSKTLLSASKTVCLLLLQSTLLAITLFVIFPRLSPFWQVPSATSAKTGLSDEVSPGDIATLALSSDLAFRVDFKGKQIPVYSELYWRAMTLENFDGRKWTRASKNNSGLSLPPMSQNTPFKPTTSGDSILYDVTVESSYQSWLFGLAIATSEDAKITSMRDYTLQSRNILSQITQYQVKSYLQSPLELNMSKRNKQRNLAIVKGSNPRLENLGSKLKQQYVNPIDRAQAVLETFRESDYFYTLQAPKLVNNSLDQFYFDTKAGFCEHYASSFTYLMRTAGIPARVVTGYLGGELNDVNAASARQKNTQEGHLSIYQYDAHAWSEIWIEGIGWQRVDPTAAVDPQRVESGWSNALLTQQLSLNNNFMGLHQFKNIAWVNALRLRLRLDALDYQWTRWVLGYSSKQQYELLKQWFGNKMLWKTAGIVAIAFICAMLLVTLLYRINFNFFKPNKTSPWVTMYHKALAMIAKRGVLKPENMTTLEFSTLVTQKLPVISELFYDFSMTFEQLNYKKLNESEQSLLQNRLKEQYQTMKKNLAQ